jgi:signal transduction histidine kinase
MDHIEKVEKITLEKALRRANLLAAAAEVAQNVAQIMDIDVLLPRTVDIICDAYDFYYAGVFLIDNVGEFAMLRAGRGEPGRIMIENNHKLAVGGNSMIGACTALNEARISLDVDAEKVWYPNPVLPETRSEMALPLAIAGRVIGAVTVQSVEAAAFSDEDISSLQAMANQLAIAIDNAHQRRALEEAGAELVRAKTFEAIATATGDAIHWIGNKAEPIGGTVDRIRHDVMIFSAAMAELLARPALAEHVANYPVAQLLLKEASGLRQNNPDIAMKLDKFAVMDLDKLEKRLSLQSLFDDLLIVEDSARLIMKVKEDMIGPAREQAPRPTMIEDVLQDAVSGLDIPPGVVSISRGGALPQVVADPVQMNRVFSNLLKNAYEAMTYQPQPHIEVTFEVDTQNDLVNVSVTDNGSGIAAEDLDKIWITFHTTKGIKGHSGLGLPACRLIMEQTGGAITVASTPGQGSTFTIGVPVYHRAEVARQEPKRRGNILLVDDADGWRAFAASALSEAGYTVVVTGEGYQPQLDQSFDLIILDDILMENDSLDILNKFKETGQINRVLAVSSNPRVERTKARMLLGVRDFVPKPYIADSLLQLVKDHWG